MRDPVPGSGCWTPPTSSSPPAASPAHRSTRCWPAPRSPPPRCTRTSAARPACRRQRSPPACSGGTTCGPQRWPPRPTTGPGCWRCSTRWRASAPGDAVPLVRLPGRRSRLPRRRPHRRRRAGRGHRAAARPAARTGRAGGRGRAAELAEHLLVVVSGALAMALRTGPARPPRRAGPPPPRCWTAGGDPPRPQLTTGLTGVSMTSPGCAPGRKCCHSPDTRVGRGTTAAPSAK